MDQALRSKLDRITNILFAGGVNNPVTYIEQLSYFIFLKLLDEREGEIQREHDFLGAGARSLSLFPAQAARYRWTEWRFKSGQELRTYLREEVFPYMASLVQEAPQVAIYFQDARLEVDDANVLKQVIDELDGIQFGKLGTDVKGDIYEYLLQYLATQEGALLGQFRTPRQIRLAMIEMLDPDFGDTVFDPACGTAGLLIDAVEYILAKYSDHVREVPIYGEEWLEKKGLTLAQARAQMPGLQTYRKGAGEKIPDWELLEGSIFGIEVSRQMMRISMMNLVLHGIRNAHVKRANALSEMGGLTDEDLRRRYKVIASNPPFAGVLPKESIRKDLPTQSKKSELLFLGLVMESLAPGGRAAVIVPEGLLFNSAAVELRRKLVTDFELLAVVSLPAGVFKPYAGVKTAILVFRRPVNQEARRRLRETADDLAKAAKKLGKSAAEVLGQLEDELIKAGIQKETTGDGPKVWFYEVRNDGFDPDKVLGGGRQETAAKNDLPDLLRQWAQYKASGFQTPPGVEAGDILPADAPDPQCWWATTDSLAESDFNLAAGRYKPQRATTTPEENPVDLIRSTLRHEREIFRGLNRLRKDMGSLK